MNKFDYQKLVPARRRALEKLYGKEVRVNRHTYTIHFVHDLRMNGKTIAGMCDPNAKKVYVDPDVDTVESTLLHEIIHAELCEGGFRQRPDFTLELEEMLCEVLSQGLAYNFYFKTKSVITKKK